MRLPEVHFPQPDVKGLSKAIWQNKLKIATVGALVVGNAVGGAIFVSQMNRVAQLEKQVETLQRVDNALVERDILLTTSLCEVDSMASGNDYPCDQLPQVGAEYWRGVIAGDK